MDTVSVQDAFNDWLHENPSLYALQRLSCVNKSWQLLLSDISHEHIFKAINRAVNQWISNVIEIRSMSDDSLFNDDMYDLKKIIKMDILRITKNNHNTVRALREYGISTEHASQIVRAMQVVFKQRRAPQTIIELGAPQVSEQFLKSLNTNLCKSHGTQCVRSRRRVCVNKKYEFELNCRCNFPDVDLHNLQVQRTCTVNHGSK